MELEEHLGAFSTPNFENSGSDGSSGKVLAKNKFCLVL
jgi:hypothetical protein